MRQLFLSLVIILSTVFFSVSAANNCGKGKKCQETTCAIQSCKAAGINLTAKQESQIRELQAECKGKENCSKEYTSKMKKILTTEQYSKFLKNNSTCAKNATSCNSSCKKNCKNDRKCKKNCNKSSCSSAKKCNKSK